jgi:hypothetical protein
LGATFGCESEGAERQPILSEAARAGARLPYRLARCHRRLFRWHCQTFFRFDKALSTAELDYLRLCFRLASGFRERTARGSSHFSYVTYSHRVRGDHVNSSRMAFGSISAPEAAWRAARPVLRERGIDPDEAVPGHERLTFYGLGWDFEAAQFKVYFLAPDIEALEPPFRELLVDRPPGSSPEGLVSVTYREGARHEDKVYVYPDPADGASQLPAGIRRRAHMLTSRRGDVEQLDLRDVGPWVKKLNAAGQRIVRRYRERGERLDTIAYQDPGSYTLYFP